MVITTMIDIHNRHHPNGDGYRTKKENCQMNKIDPEGFAGDEAEPLHRDNNDCKAKHDCLKKLSTSGKLW